MKIIVDAMGGDFAPLAPVKGALMAHERYGAEILLVGKEEEIQKTLRECGCAALPTGVEIVNATEVVEICYGVQEEKGFFPHRGAYDAAQR